MEVSKQQQYSFKNIFLSTQTSAEKIKLFYYFFPDEYVGLTEQQLRFLSLIHLKLVTYEKCGKSHISMYT